MDYTVAYLQSKKNDPETLVRIGVCDTPFEQKILPIFLRKLRESESNLNIQFVFVLNNSIGELLNHHVDLCAIAREDVDIIEDINFEPMVQGKIVIACPQGSKLAEKAEINISDLVDQDLFLLDPNSSLNVQLNFQTALINKLGMDHIKFVQDFLAMDIYVRGGWGYGILPNFIADYQTEGIKYIPIDYHDISPYGIAYMESFTNDSVLEKVVSTLKSAINEYLFENKNK